MNNDIRRYIFAIGFIVTLQISIILIILSFEIISAGLGPKYVIIFHAEKVIPGILLLFISLVLIYKYLCENKRLNSRKQKIAQQGDAPEPAINATSATQRSIPPAR